MDTQNYSAVRTMGKGAPKTWSEHVQHGVDALKGTGPGRLSHTSPAELLGQLSAAQAQTARGPQMATPVSMRSALARKDAGGVMKPWALPNGETK